MVVEVMGRHAGWIALHGGLAGGADVILIPEIPFDFEKIAEAIRWRDAAGDLSSLVVVAEGAKAKDGQQIKRDMDSGEFRLGGIGDIVAREIAARTGKETRACVLGHLQRGGAPRPWIEFLERALASRPCSWRMKAILDPWSAIKIIRCGMSPSQKQSIVSGWFRPMVKWCRPRGTWRFASEIESRSRTKDTKKTRSSVVVSLCEPW